MKKELSTDRLLTQLNNDSLTDRERAEILRQILDIELEKPEAEADMDLIQECFDYLELLNNSDAEIEERKEQLPDRLQRTYQKAAETEIDAKEPLVSQIRPVKRKRCFRKAGIAAAIAAAILLISMTSLTVIARVNGYDSTWEWLSKHWDEYLGLNKGEQMTIDGITVIRETETIIYPDMESCLKEENLNILYPSDLPEGIRLDYINQSARGEGEVCITLVFNTPEVNFHAQNYDLAHYEIHEEVMEIIEADGYRFGILYIPELVCAYNAYFTVDNFAYTVGCQDRDTLLFILNHLKNLDA